MRRTPVRLTPRCLHCGGNWIADLHDESISCLQCGRPPATPQWREPDREHALIGRNWAVEAAR